MEGPALTFKGITLGFQKRRRLLGFRECRNRSTVGPPGRRTCMTNRANCYDLWLGSLTMETRRISTRVGIAGIFGSSAKPRSVRVQASDGDIENVVPSNPQGKPSGTVLPYVGVACLGAILFGYHVGVVNGALEYLAKDLGIAENTVLQGWVVSTVLAGATIGSFTGGVLADKFGRTRTFQLDAIPLAIGAFLCATAQCIQTMIIGRLLTGIGIGVTSAIVPLYISEISPTEVRGALGSVNQLFICIGILVALVAGLPLAGNPIWWRTMFGIAVVPSILLALGMAISPESPRWLVQQGKISEAEKAIKTLYGKERAVVAMRDLTSSTQGFSEPEAGWFDLFSSRYWKVVSIGAALFLFQQFAGINAVVYYSTSVFRSAGIASDVAASALVGAANVLGSAVAFSLMDRRGRKSLLITSYGGMVWPSSCREHEKASSSAAGPATGASHNQVALETSPISITSHKLNGLNCLQWSQSVMIFLFGRGKEDYVVGTAITLEREQILNSRYGMLKTLWSHLRSRASSMTSAKEIRQ